MHILIVEDDVDIAANLYDFLEARGHSADAAPDGLTGLHLAATLPFDAIILDLSLPGLNGLELARKLREQARHDTPILMLTARDTLEDKLAGFDAGADDYLVKPFALREVEARLTALVKRRQGRVVPSVLRAAGIELDPQTLEVRFEGSVLRLPPKCLRILEVLMHQPNKVHGRPEIERAVWGAEQESSDTLRSHIHTLRKSLTRADGSCPIETVHGLGYRLVDR